MFLIMTLHYADVKPTPLTGKPFLHKVKQRQDYGPADGKQPLFNRRKGISDDDLQSM
jgi:hypothetical protein